jgi:N-methylhydantoinase B/oxoprolinase/acetone carboxylase alpha subunit
MTEKATRAESSKNEAPKNTADHSADAGNMVSQPTPAQSQTVRQDGLQIDGFGLPVNGVARAKVLGELSEKDPVADPSKWSDTLATKARKLTEKFYG